MKRKILGFRLHMESKKGNKGSLLFVGYEQPSVTGMSTETIWVPDDIKLPNIKLGDDIKVFYNSSGFFTILIRRSFRNEKRRGRKKLLKV